MGIAIGAKRFYRNWHSKTEGVTYEVRFRQTDLWIRSKKNYSKQILSLVTEIHRILHLYASKNPAFFSSLKPLPWDPLAHPFIKRMLKASQETNVGPMACVAGLIAEIVGTKLTELDTNNEIIVENGGDCFVYSRNAITVEVFPAGVKTGKTIPLKLSIEPDEMPVCVCTSSSRIGHSLSLGKADVVTVISKDGAFADAAATSLCNEIKSVKHLKQTVETWSRKEKIFGIVAMINGHIAIKGNIKIV